jgi:hypothetical protein
LIIVALSHVANPLAWDPDLNAVIVRVVELVEGDVVLVGAVGYTSADIERLRDSAPHHGLGSRRDSLTDAVNEASSHRVSADLQLKKQE